MSHFLTHFHTCSHFSIFSRIFTHVLTCSHSIQCFVLFPGVSRAPRGPSSESSQKTPGKRRWEKVGEGGRKFEKVRESSQKAPGKRWEKVGKHRHRPDQKPSRVLIEIDHTNAWQLIFTLVHTFSNFSPMFLTF